MNMIASKYDCFDDIKIAENEIQWYEIGLNFVLT